MDKETEEYFTASSFSGDLKGQYNASAIINELMLLFTEADSRKAYLDMVVNLLQKHSSCRYIGIRVLDGENNIRYESYTGFSSDFWQSENCLSLDNDQCICTRVTSGCMEPVDIPYLTTNCSFYCDNTSELVSTLTPEQRPLFRAVCMKHGYTAVAVIPVRRKDDILGAIHLAETDEDKMPQELVELVERLTPFIAEAMYRFTVEEKLQQNYNNQHMLNWILTQAQERIELPLLLRKVLELVCSIPWLPPNAGGSIFLVDELPEKLKLTAHYRAPENYVKEKAAVELREIACGQAAKTRLITFSGTTQLSGSEETPTTALNEYYCIPIISSGETIGMFVLLAAATKPLKPEHEEFLSTIVSTVAGVIVRKQAEEALRESEANLAQAQSIASLGHWHWDITKNVLRWSLETYRIFGVSAENAVITYDYFLDMVHPEDRADLDNAVKNALKNRVDYNVEHRIIKACGDVRIVHEQARITYNDSGVPVSMIGTVQDITELKEAIGTISFQASLLNQVRNAVIATDLEGKITYWNKHAETIYQWKAEEVLGKLVFDVTVPEEGQVTAKDIMDGISNRGYWEGEFITRRKDNTCFPTQIFLTVIYSDAGQSLGVVGVSMDISERKRMEKQIKFLATNDPLTGTANRYVLEENLKRVVARAKRGVSSTLLLLDLDNFGLINDSIGYDGGDALLVKMVDVMRGIFQEDELIARIEGDQFAVILEGKGEIEGRETAEKLRQSIEDGPFKVNLSATVAVFLIDGTVDHKTIITRSGIGINIIKEGGRNRVSVIKQNDKPKATLSDTHKIINIVKSALKHDLFQLYFQPIIDVKTNTIVHYEGLLRMAGNRYRHLSPGKFVPLAEQYGLMPQLDRRVVQMSLNALKRYPGLTLFINLSGASLSDDTILNNIVSDVLNSGISPGRIGFEITETAAVKNLSVAEEWIKKLRGMGCSFALDDFGIGFSALSYLKLLSVDYLKIDGFFIRNLDKNSEDYVMVNAISSLARAMGIKTIAEFVENREIFYKLQQLQIDCAQGYYIGKPTEKPSKQVHQGDGVPGAIS